MTTDEIRRIAERLEQANHRRDNGLVHALERMFAPQSHERLLLAAEVKRIAAERRATKPPTYFN